LFRSSWSQLHTVCRGISLGSTRYTAPLSCWRANPQKTFSITGERFASTGPLVKFLECPRGRSLAPTPLSRYDYQKWTASSFSSKQGEVAQSSFSRLRSRLTGVYGFSRFSEEDNTRNEGTPKINCKRRSWNEFFVHSKQDQKDGQKEELVGRDVENYATGLMKLLEFGDSKQERSHKSLYQGVETQEKRHLLMHGESTLPRQNFGHRELYLRRSAAKIAQQFLSWSSLGFTNLTPSHGRCMF
jgi:hypothetical protein